MNHEALLTDLYELTMLQAYFDEGMQDRAVFELFVRRLPEARNFLLVAGIEQALDYLECLRFTPDELGWLADSGRFSSAFLQSLRDFRFSGDVWAMREGTPCFANEPILRVEAPIGEAQFVESRLINLIHFSTMVASKAARCVLAAQGRLLVDFGLRRAHGGEAGLLAVRAILDDGGLTDVRLFASGNLDEYRIAALLAAGAPIDGFGVGTMLTTSGDAPSLDMVYKLQRYAGVPRRKRSEGKATWPDAKPVWRQRDAHGTPREDEITLADEIRSPSESTSLLAPVMRSGRRVAPRESLDALRQHAADKLMHLPPALRALDPPEQPYPVTISPRLRALADELDREPH